MINLYDYKWFYQRQDKDDLLNVYSGSIGTSPTGGCMNTTTFCYRVFADITTDPHQLVAECYLQYPWNVSPRTSEVQRCVFEASDAGVEQARLWLEEKHQETTK